MFRMFRGSLTHCRGKDQPQNTRNTRTWAYVCIPGSFCAFRVFRCSFPSQQLRAEEADQQRKADNMRKRGSIPFVRYFILCVPCVPCAPWFVNPLKRKGPTTENTEHTEMGIFSAFPSQRLRAEEADQQWKAENTRKRGSIPFVRYLILCVPCVLWFATHCRGKDQPRNTWKTRKGYARL